VSPRPPFDVGDSVKISDTDLIQSLIVHDRNRSSLTPYGGKVMDEKRKNKQLSMHTLNKFIKQLNVMNTNTLQGHNLQHTDYRIPSQSTPNYISPHAPLGLST